MSIKVLNTVLLWTEANDLGRGYCTLVVSKNIAMFDFKYLSFFSEPGEHDNSPTLPVMDHLPEVSACGLHGTLGYDESLLLLVALYIS